MYHRVEQERILKMQRLLEFSKHLHDIVMVAISMDTPMDIIYVVITIQACSSRFSCLSLLV